MANNKKIGNYAGNVDLPNSTTAKGVYVGSEQARFRGLASWPTPITGLVASVGDYVFAASSGVVTAASGTEVGGYLCAFGDEFASSEYSELFDKIGGNYGGNGTNTFAVPSVWGSYGYLRGAAGASGVTVSGNIPIHTHTGQCLVRTPKLLNIGPGAPWDGNAALQTSSDGNNVTNNGRFKEMVPLVCNALTKSIPIGSYIQFMLPTTLSNVYSVLPEGVLVCSGQDVSRAGYDKLFERLGTDYGTGDGSTTFTLPDTRGVFLRGPESGKNTKPDPLTGGQGYGASGNAKHYHGMTVQQGPPNTGYPAQAQGNSTNVSAPATSNSSYGNSEARPKNITVLNCIVASGTV
jgi:microcystin-dependent protein